MPKKPSPKPKKVSITIRLDPAAHRRILADIMKIASVSGLPQLKMAAYIEHAALEFQRLSGRA
jgi:hypothetical protein